MKLFGKEFKFNNNKVYHAGDKPTASEIGAAAASHGNHIPNKETANNARFLRNDNTWQSIDAWNVNGVRASEMFTGSQNVDTYNPSRTWTGRTTSSSQNGATTYSTVLNVGANGNSNFQISHIYNGDSSFYVRGRHDTSGKYTTWARVYTTQYKPTANDVGALAKTGGDISNNLTVWGSFQAELDSYFHGDLHVSESIAASRFLKAGNESVFIGPAQASISCVKTNVETMYVSGKYRNIIATNLYHDGANDVHYDKTQGASQLILEKNQYPKFRWSNSGEPTYGIPQWNGTYTVLTDYAPQQVCCGRAWVQLDWDWNSYENSGIYPVSNAISGANRPPNSYYFGILIVFSSGGVVGQIYIPHSSSHFMQYRCRYESGVWTHWCNVGWSQYNMPSTLEEPEASKIEELEKRIKDLENLLK